MQDNELAPRDVDIGESDTESRKKRRITFKERLTHEDEHDHGSGKGAQSSGELGARGTKEQSKWRLCFQGFELLGT